MKATRTSRAAAIPVALLLLVVGAAPAGAVHQYCGDGAEGIHLGGYPSSESLGNGHPNGSGGSWAGSGAVGPLSKTLYGLDRAETHIQNLIDALDEFELVPTKSVNLGFSIAKLALHIAKTGVGAALLHNSHRNAEVDACGGVLTADMLDAIFVGTLQEELGLLGAARATGVVGEGSRIAGSSAFLLPDDGILDVTPDGDTYADRHGHDADSLAAAQFWEGFADADYVGVAVVVRNAIAHLQAHGVDTADAEVRWKEAMDLLSNGLVRDAYGVFADAYYLAVNPFSAPH